MSKRKFKLRCGAIVEESPGQNVTSAGTMRNYDGFIDDYRYVSGGEEYKEYLDGCGGLITLSLGLVGMPVGGAHGPDFDIVEEVFD